MLIAADKKGGEPKPFVPFKIGQRVRDKITGIVGSICGYEWNKPGVLSAIPYSVEWNNPTAASLKLGIFGSMYSCHESLEPIE